MHNKKLSYLKELSNSGENLLFADENKLDLKLDNAKLVRCLFIRISCKSARINGTTFHRCVFKDCYFREGIFHDVDFTASFFKDCNLEKAIFRTSRFWYVRFIRCQLNYDGILESLSPLEPNIAILLLKTLRQNAIQMGEKRTADKLLVKQIDFEKRDFKNRIWGSTDYYRQKKYRGFYSKIVNSFRWISLVLSGWIWGHGLKIKNLLLSAFILIFIFAGLLFCSGRSDPVPMSFGKSLYLSSATFATFGYIKDVPSSPLPLILCSIESFLGIIFLGFFAASVYRKFSR